MTAPLVAVVGLWHLGSVLAGGLACHGIATVGLDRGARVVEGLNRAEPPLYEPGLTETVRDGLDSGALRFSADPEALAPARFVWLAADTDLTEDNAVDTASLVAAVDWAAPHVRPDAILLVSSQIPLGTTEALRDELARLRPDWRPRAAYLPENLRLGSAVERFHRPDWLVVGTDDDATATEVIRLLAPIDCEATVTSVRSAELAKHAVNTYLAACITLANELGDLAEVLGADGLAIARIMRSDSRIAPGAPLRPGVGFSGGTLSREVRTLRDLGRANGVPTPLADAIAVANRARGEKVYRELSARLDLDGALVAVLGVVYRPHTSATRDSDSLRLVGRLAAAGARVRVHDPYADFAEVVLPSAAALVPDVAGAAAGADALVVMSEHDAYRDLDLAALVAGMAGRIVVDPHHLLTRAAEGSGAQYLAFGRASTGVGT